MNVNPCTVRRMQTALLKGRYIRMLASLALLLTMSTGSLGMIDQAGASSQSLVFGAVGVATGNLSIGSSDSCWSPGNCQAASFNQIGNDLAVYDETNGVWSMTPHAFSQVGQSAALSCWGPHQCMLVGIDASGNGVESVESANGWSAFSTFSSGGNLTQVAVSCVAGSCSVLGTPTVGFAQYVPFVAMYLNGSWASILSVDPIEEGGATAISCWAAFACEIVGYNLGTGAFAVSFAGTFTSPSPSDFSPSVQLSVGSSLYFNANAVSCTSADNCVAAGTNYASYPANLDPSATTWIDRGGVWSSGTMVDQTNRAELSQVSCWSTFNCVAVGSSWSSGGIYVPIDNAQSGALTDLPASEAPLFNAVFCTGPNQCSFAGFQNNGSFDFVASQSVGSLVFSSPSLPSGNVGTAYSASVGLSGGLGAPTVSVASGTLPLGITLDPATGILSGTPTTPGTYSFTLTASQSIPISLSTSQDYVMTITAQAAEKPATLAATGSPLMRSGFVGAFLLFMGTAAILGRRSARRSSL